MHRLLRHGLTTCLFALLGAACAADDPELTAEEKDEIRRREGLSCNASYTEDISACMPKSTDYTPRTPSSDTWASCVTDDNVWHTINSANISTISRVAAYETIADKLWENESVPTPQNFDDARIAFLESEGLGSRVGRRGDIHYTAPASGKRCNETETSGVAVVDAYPEYCVGPRTLLPIINTAFDLGHNNDAPVLQAARIEAALFWFLYVSVLSEITTCTTTAKDCDSAWAYYGGGGDRANPLGFGRLAKALGEASHDRNYDAVLGIRCWRDLDSATTASNIAMRDQIRAQNDDSLLRTVGLMVRNKFNELGCATGEYQAAAYEFLKVVVPLLDRESRERDADQADILMAQIEHEDPAKVDYTAALAAIDALYDCP